MDEERLEEASKERRCKIVESVVMEILKTSDLETTTELGVRAVASQRLGFDLIELPHRQLVRQLVDSFLLSTAISIHQTRNNNHNHNHNNNNDTNEIALNDQKQQQPERFTDKLICKLSDRRRVTVHDLNGRTMVSIRDFYVKDGIMHPRKDAKSGISMTSEQWLSFRNSFPLIQEGIAKMESRLGLEAIAKQSEAEMRSSVANSAPPNNQVEACSSDFTSTVHPPSMRKQTEADTSRFVIVSNTQEHLVADGKQDEAGISGTITTSDSPGEISAETRHTETDVPTPGQSPYSVHGIHAERQIPIQPARLDGRNYQSWRHHMEFFLKQLNLAYVLVKPCPSICLNPQASFAEKVEAQAAIQRWVDDDYMCHNHILKSLSDSLFQRYSEKSYSARDLWEELRLLYDEDFGTSSSQINKYITFQMVDGVSVLEQVQELHRIADSIMAFGIGIDENFHVSAIVSKLPPSWKELRIRLMHEEFLPLSLLMHRLQVEEESRNFCKKETNYKKGQTTESRLDYRPGMRRKENKRVCYGCGREGHIIKSCPSRKSEFLERNNENENGVLPPRTDTNMVEAANEK